MGRLPEVKPQGMLMPQMLARFADMVYISDRYICSGSSTFSPILKAAVGEVGRAIRSTSSKAFRKSSRMSVRTFWARR